jgi:single-strand DNA-binding protein
MPSINSVTLLGNVTRHPELRHTPSGTAVTEIGLAINRVRTDDHGQKIEEVTFVDVTLWARTAEIAAKYLKKGDSTTVQGRLVTDTWQDKETGKTRSKLTVTGHDLQLLYNKRQDDYEAPPAYGPPNTPPVSKPEPTKVKFTEEMPI